MGNPREGRRSPLNFVKHSWSSEASSLESSSFGRATSDWLDLVDTNDVIAPSGEKMSSRLGPGEGLAAKEFLSVLWLDVHLVWFHGIGSDLFKNLLWWEVKDLDAVLGGDDKPVEFLGEENTVDGRSTVVLGEVLSVDDVPDHDHTIMRARCEIGRVLDNIKGGNLSLVSSESVHKGHVEVVPDLDSLVPGGSNADGWLLGVVESDTWYGVFVLVLVNGMLALGTGIPDLDVSIKTSGYDLSVISWKGNWEHISLMSNELANSSAGSDVPESDSAIPGSWEAESRITGEFDFADEVRVAYNTKVNTESQDLPVNILFGLPHSLSGSSSFLVSSSHLIRVLSREPDKRNSTFSSPTCSSPTARVVTQPPWPKFTQSVRHYQNLNTTFGRGWSHRAITIISWLIQRSVWSHGSSLHLTFEVTLVLELVLLCLLFFH